MAAKLKIWTGNNFLCTELIDIVDTSPLLNSDNVLIDSRNNLLTVDWDSSNWDWYLNYLTSCVEVYNHPSGYITGIKWLLDLGYVPVVYLPSCLLHWGSTLISALDQTTIPYVVLGAMSMCKRKVGFITRDAWVSKLDAAKFFGIKPQDVTSKLIVEEVLKYAR